MSAYRDIYQTWDIISVLLSKEIKLRYRGTILGIVWSLANPIAFSVVLYIAFKRVLQVDIPNYPVFILSALFPWQALANSIGAAAMLFITNAPLIKKLPFPKVALCFAVVLNDVIHFAITIPLLAALLLITRAEPPSLSWLVGVPVLIVSQVCLTVGIVMIIATVNAFLRDLEQLVRVLMLLLFYVTPVLYPVSMIPEGLQWLIWLNPFSPLIISWRALLADNALSPYMLMAVVHAAAALMVAVPVYRSTEWRLAEAI
jgi:lipopolysaccharide transport system permease protein